MDESHRETMTKCRTIFLKNGEPHYEDLSPLPDLWWVSTKLSPADYVASDVKLMDIVVEHLQASLFEVTHCTAMHHQEQLYVSFPVLNPDVEISHGWFSLAIAQAEHYQQEIIAGRLAVDRCYLFGIVDPRSQIELNEVIR
ncbi:hypothetical protein N7457_001407 [Penicillium paradoxum]|uniref:uncharacterized protein n=1 Tax=Penicillium paradoxum TaxID=176176 RepID=UPI002546583A|nr:uncharacterized protein N7457_001407 [Penicillium paradoxum]KAJ5794808.1 hypothetical protein N7457_001407 [Penicillium paradoxum]